MTTGVSSLHAPGCPQRMIGAASDCECDAAEAARQVAAGAVRRSGLSILARAVEIARGGPAPVPLRGF